MADMEIAPAARPTEKVVPRVGGAREAADGTEDIQQATEASGVSVKQPLPEEERLQRAPRSSEDAGGSAAAGGCEDLVAEAIRASLESAREAKRLQQLEEEELARAHLESAREAKRLQQLEEEELSRAMELSLASSAGIELGQQLEELHASLSGGLAAGGVSKLVGPCTAAPASAVPVAAVTAPAGAGVAGSAEEPKAAATLSGPIDDAEALGEDLLQGWCLAEELELQGKPREEQPQQQHGTITSKEPELHGQQQEERPQQQWREGQRQPAQRPTEGPAPPPEGQASAGTAGEEDEVEPEDEEWLMVDIPAALLASEGAKDGE